MVLPLLGACEIGLTAANPRETGVIGTVVPFDTGGTSTAEADADTDADTDADADSDADSDTDTDSDTGTAAVSTTPSSTTSTGGAPVLGVADLQVGDLVITEIMRDPSDESDDLGEWFELWNATGSAVDLIGLAVKDDGIDSFTVSTSLVVEGGARVVLGRDPSGAGGHVDYAYGSAMSLANGADELVVEGTAGELDRVAWDDGTLWPLDRGASLSLDPGDSDPASDDLPASWCSATTVYGATDRGTPGAPNDSC